MSLCRNCRAACQYLAARRTTNISGIACLRTACLLLVSDLGCRVICCIYLAVLFLTYLTDCLLCTACRTSLMSLGRNYCTAHCNLITLCAVGVSGIALLSTGRFCCIFYYRLWMTAHGSCDLHGNRFILIIALIRPGVNCCRCRLHTNTQCSTKIAVLPCPVLSAQCHIRHLLTVKCHIHGIAGHIRRILRLVHRQLYLHRYRFIIDDICRRKYYLILCRITVGHSRLDIRCIPCESTCHLRIPSGQRRRISLTVAIHSFSAVQSGLPETVSIGNLCRRGNRLKIRLCLRHRHIDHHVKGHIITVARLIMHFIAVYPCRRNLGGICPRPFTTIQFFILTANCP